MRAAGNTTIAVPSVGFGTWAPGKWIMPSSTDLFSSKMKTSNSDEKQCAEDPSWCTSAVSQALKVGYRHLDCAWEYGVCLADLHTVKS